MTPLPDDPYSAEIDEILNAYHLWIINKHDGSGIKELTYSTYQAKAALNQIVRKARYTIATPCPACKHTSLIISSGNWLVCGNLECNDPAAINGKLQQPDDTTKEVK